MRHRVGVLVGVMGVIGSVASCGGDPTPVSFCGPGEVRRDGQCLANVSVSMNTVGFLPGRHKRATFSAETAEFELMDAKTDEVVFEGKGKSSAPAFDGGEAVYVADFSEFVEEGEYYLRVGAGRSATFRIGEGVLDGALNAAMLGLYGQRCGVSVEIEYEGDTFRHGAGHREPASLSRLDMDEEKDDTGGWHDAGDYGKYVRNGAFAVAFLLRAYEDFPEFLAEASFGIPESGGDIPDILDEARVELAWILKTQLDDGSFAHKVTALRFEGQVAPTADQQPRYFFSTSTTSTADAVAVLAAAGRIFHDFDEDFASECLDAAVRGQVFLDEHPEEIESDQSGAGTGTYGSKGDRDERAWALAELWATTEDATYLQQFEEIAQDLGLRFNFDWADTENLAIAAYLSTASDARDPATVARFQQQVISSADDMAEASLADPYGRGFDSYYWGSAGVVARMGLNLILAHQMFPNRAYLDALTLKLDHLLGLNPFGRSWVTGVGANPPRNPHHRPSVSDSVAAPWPGLLIGGANPGPLDWQDVYESYEQNEVAINWNTALVYALAAVRATQDDEDAACVPDCRPEGAPPGGGGAGGAGGQSGQ